MSPALISAVTGPVVVVGSLNVDRSWSVPVIPLAGQTVLARDPNTQFGGKGGNQAVAAARQGAAVTLIGAVGEDADGQSYLAHLQQERVDTALIARTARPTGSAHIYVDGRGENMIFVDLGANEVLVRSGLARVLELALPGAGALVLQLECGVEAAALALDCAAQHGVKAILNASPYSPAFRWGRHHLHLVIVNEHECVDFFRLSPERLAGLDDAERPRFLREAGIGHLVITRGAEPTLVLSAGRVQWVAVHPVRPVDTVGAGDTFAGVLAVLVARGTELAAAVAEANVAAALSTLVRGAQAGIPTRAQVQAVLLAGLAEPEVNAATPAPS